jgi:hypothetical protein
MVYQRLHTDSTFLETLLRIEADLAEATRTRGCGACGNVVHQSLYPRKPRGPWKLGRPFCFRMSFCCSRCRKRETPPSVLFLGRRWYLGVVVVLAAALCEGPTRARMVRIEEVWGVGLDTVTRWRRWWREAFAESAFWRAGRARMMPRGETALPLSLVEAFGITSAAPIAERVAALLRWLSPLTTRPGLPAHP